MGLYLAVDNTKKRPSIYERLDIPEPHQLRTAQKDRPLSNEDTLYRQWMAERERERIIAWESSLDCLYKRPKAFKGEIAIKLFVVVFSHIFFAIQILRVILIWNQ